LWRGLEARADDVLTTLELVDESGDAELTAELDREVAALEADFGRERTALLFSGEYDQGGAILSISAGAGGTEATDWAEMLLRMYLRWAERHRFKTEIVDQQEGEQAGIKSATVEIDGRAAYGWMRAERGVHRLVRISPFDSQKRRQTTFALVEVLPEADDDIQIELNWDEIRVDTFRSQGAGGQHVNKTDSAVRLTHLPTNIVAQSQNERSQTQNKEMAIRVLKARLLERALEEQEAEVRKLKGEHVEAGWGNQIRSYVLHPYQMVKDLRTGVETGNTQAVLDGDLDTFMQAELERLATGDSPRAGDVDDGEDEANEA
jgi:peptide chain release factor 2